MEQKTNYARINDESKLEIHTDSATFIDGETQITIGGKTFEISGEDLMKIYALLQDREITHLLNIRDNGYFNTINNYVIVGKDVEKKRLMDMYVKLLNEVENINDTRHWWERKIKIKEDI